MRIKRLLLPIIICIFVVALCSCSKAPSSATLLIYMCGSDLESKTGIASENINELLSANIPDNVNVIIETGGSTKWQSNNIPFDKIMRYVVKDHRLQEIARLDDACMGSADTLQSFVEFGTTAYPSDNTMLLLWDHGGGTVKGACFDERYNNDTLTVPELKEALEGGLQGKRLSVVGFDACLMADYEVAKALSDYADMLIASQNYEVGLGWDYSTITRSLSKKTGADLAKAICDDYMDKCVEVSKDGAATLSAIDLTNFEEITKAFDDMMAGINNEMEGNKARLALRIATKNAASFGANSTGHMDNFVDLAGAASILADHNMYKSNEQEIYTSKAKTVDNLISDAIIYKVNGDFKANATGLSVYYPSHYYMDEIREYLKICPSEAYRQLIMGIFNDIPQTTISYQNRGYIGDDGKFHVTLTPESSRYLLNVTYTVYEQNEDGSLGNPIISKYVKNEDSDWENLDFAVNFDGKCFELEKNPIMATQVDVSANNEIYMSKVIRNGVPETFRFVVLKGILGKQVRQVGVVLFNDEVGTASRDVLPLKPGDKIEVDGNTFTIDIKGLTLKKSDIRSSKYAVQVVAYDMFGNEFKSDVSVFDNE